MPVAELFNNEKFKKLLSMIERSTQMPLAFCSSDFTRTFYKTFDGDLCRMPFSSPVSIGTLNFFLVLNQPFALVKSHEKDHFFLVRDMVEYFLKNTFEGMSCEEDLDETTKYLKMEKKYLYELGNILKSDYALHETAQKILDLTVQHFQIERGSIMLLDDLDELYFVAAHNIPPEVVQIVRVKNGEGICGYVAQSGKPILVEDADDFKNSKDIEKIVSQKTTFQTNSFICMPLIIREQVLGVINLTDKKGNAPFTSKELELLLAISSQISAVLHNYTLINRLGELNEHLEAKVAERTSELEKALNSLEAVTEEIKKKNSILEEIAVTDKLTSLFNRGYFEDRLKFEIEKSFQFKSELSLLIIDVDHFKDVNDNYGHPVGDKVLQLLSDHIRSVIRQTDIAARYGGDEFVVILPDTKPENAEIVAEKLRASVEAQEFCVEDQCVKFTISIGVAGIAEGQSTSFEKLVDFTDKSLFKAKAKGRNQVYMMALPSTLFNGD